MRKFIKIFGILSISCLAIISLHSNTAHAQLTDDNSGFVDTFRLHFSDLQNGVNTFSLATDKKITDESFYTGTGVELKQFYFDQYDIETDQYFKISIDNGTQSVSFGKYFDVDQSRNIRFLPGSKIHLVEADRGLFGGADDPIDLKIQFDGSKNRISMMKNKKLQGHGTPDWKWKAILDAINIDLNIEVPLKIGSTANTTTIDNKIFIVDKNNKPTNIEVTKNMKVIAEIQITKNGIIFNNGIKSLETTQIPKNKDGNKKETDNDNKIISEVKFTGNGLVTPAANKFKGISNERNLEQFIVGVTNFILGFVAAVAVLMLIYGGYLWIVDRGEGQLAEKSRKIIAGAVIGILIIISAYTIVNTVITLEGNPDECAVGFEVGNGTDFNLNCTTNNTTAIGTGIGGILGSTIGGWIGGDTGSIIGGLLGGGAGAGAGAIGEHNHWW